MAETPRGTTWTGVRGDGPRRTAWSHRVEPDDHHAPDLRLGWAAGRCASCNEEIGWRDEAEAQDTAASSGLREALDSHPMGAGVWADELDRRVDGKSAHSRQRYIDWMQRVRAALAHSAPEPRCPDCGITIADHPDSDCGINYPRHSTPEPSLRAALAAALRATEWWKHARGTDDWTNGELADAIIAALPGLSLSAQPSEPGETE